MILQAGLLLRGRTTLESKAKNGADKVKFGNRNGNQMDRDWSHSPRNHLLVNSAVISLNQVLIDNKG
jgi:hypothetical protein